MSAATLCPRRNDRAIAILAAGVFALVSMAGTATADVSRTPPSAGPGPQESSAGIYDALRGRVVLFGGWNGAPLGTTWSLRLGRETRWTRLATGGDGPAPRYAASLVYVPNRDLVLLFGGASDGMGATRFNDVWALDLAGKPTWTRVPTEGEPPSGRYGHMAIYDPVGDRMIVFGGYDGAFEPDVWQLSLAGDPTWSELSLPGPGPTARDFGTVIYDPLGGRMLLFGGNSVVGLAPATAANDVWALGLGAAPAWSRVATRGTPPSPRLLHASFYDPSRQRMVTMGGTDATTWLDDTYALSLDGSPPTWSAISPPGSRPAVRSDHLFVYDPDADRAILFGGRHPDPFLGDVWTLGFADRPMWQRAWAGRGLPLQPRGPRGGDDRSRGSYI